MPSWKDIASFCNQFGFYQENLIEELLYKPKNQEIIGKDEEEPVSCTVARNASDQQIPLFQNSSLGLPCLIEHSFFPDSSELGNNFQKELIKDVSGSDSHDYTPSNGSLVNQKLSTEQILKMAGERFLQFASQKLIAFPMFRHPYIPSLSDLSVEDKRDVELTELLLAAAEKVTHQQFDIAMKLLTNCQWVASSDGTPVQRAVFYFAKALMERIIKETRGVGKGEKNVDACHCSDVLSLLAMHQELPFFQVLHLTAVQTILETVRMKPKVHLIDFDISIGLHWPALMQAITQQEMDPSGYLKITTVETLDKDVPEKTGNLLKNFAKHLNLPFLYKVVLISDMKDLREEELEIEPEEVVVVHFPFILRTLISNPACLKNLMTITQNIKPSVIVVSEVEANHNSPSFVNRFIEALFFYCALFDSLEESMARDDKNRMSLESRTFWEGIRNMVTTEGCERVTRSIPINVWRAFFARFGMVELELSTASIYQASLIVEQFSCGKSCTLDVSSKGLIVGWKETPLFSLSVWKFR